MDKPTKKELELMREYQKKFDLPVICAMGDGAFGLTPEERKRWLKEQEKNPPENEGQNIIPKSYEQPEPKARSR